MLRLRLISGVLLAGGMLVLCWIDAHEAWTFGRPGLWLIPLAFLVAILAAAEVLELLPQSERPRRSTVYTGVILVLVGASVPALLGPDSPIESKPDGSALDRFGFPLVAVGVAVAQAFGGEILRYKAPGGVIIRVAMAVFTVVYVGLLMAFLILLREFHSHQWGLVALLSCVAVVKMTDVGAYTCGRLFGRRKMAPLLSPGKTIEGALGGIATGTLTSVVTLLGLAPLWIEPGAGVDLGPREIVGAVLYGVILSSAGILGDLSESLLKRDMNKKDSSARIPGMGGMLDVVDSLLLAAPIAYLLWTSGLVGPKSLPFDLMA